MFVRSLLNRIGIGYVKFDGTEAQLWREAARHISFSYRWFGRSLSTSDLDEELSSSTDWPQLRKQICDGDRICPFKINPRTSKIRRGYVVIRDGQPIGGVIVEMS